MTTQFKRDAALVRALAHKHFGPEAAPDVEAIKRHIGERLYDSSVSVRRLMLGAMAEMNLSLSRRQQKIVHDELVFAKMRRHAEASQ